MYPLEIENRIDDHPAVEEVAVVGVDHRTLGQEVKAIVVLRDGHSLDEQELKDFEGEWSDDGAMSTGSGTGTASSSARVYGCRGA